MKLNVITILGTVLLVLGVLALVGVGIPGQESMSVGGFEATVSTERSVSPVVALLLVGLGVGGVLLGQKKA